MLQHQHIVHRINAKRDRHSRVPGLLLILACVAWSAYCFATPGQPIVAHPTFTLGPPGTTMQDWREGTTSDSSPGLYIDRSKLCGWEHCGRWR